MGNVTQFDNNLQQKSLQEIGYNDKDVFDLQFGYYNPIINILDKRKDEQGVIIAGTYLPYFLHNQHGIKSDGFLIDLRKNVSDNDPCKTYLRLADQKTQYIVIDPNIASVVMGGGNSTLRDRIFAKMDATQHHVVEEGSMTMIAKMISNGYMSLASTNMINARYAFTLSYDQLKAVYPSMSDDENLFRTKLATLRFWPEAQQLFSALGTIFTQRMSRGEAIGDIASILGKSVDESKIQALATSILTQKKLVADAIANLNADEKMVLVQYLSLYNMMKTNNQQYQQVVGSFLQQSVL